VTQTRWNHVYGRTKPKFFFVRMINAIISTCWWSPRDLYD